MAIEFADAEQVDSKVDERKNVKAVSPRTKTSGKVGEVAHYHHRIGKTEEWDAPCKFAQYKVRWRDGFVINDVLYVRMVTVPQCTADALAHMDQEREISEAAVHSNKGRPLNLGYV